jgi:hypothetical protein
LRLEKMLISSQTCRVVYHLEVDENRTGDDDQLLYASFLRFKFDLVCTFIPLVLSSELPRCDL